MQPTEEDKRLKTFANLDAYVGELEGKRPLRRVLIANNGIAAVKFIRSVRSWAYATFGKEREIQFVGMATPEDLLANAEYIRYSDEVCHVPGGSNVNNYANVNLIVEIAQQYKVDAVWAGWGHASENPRLPNTLDELGIVFIGPPGAPMYALGDKIGSTIIAQSAKVPTIAWNGEGLEVNYAESGNIPPELYDQANVKTVEDARREIERLGVPVMIKASEGGGGKGIRVVDDYSKVEAAYRQVQSEIPGSPIFIMRLSSASRHLEVQLLADMYGQAIALSGRDCSVQRRHQKILEEGPPIAAKPATWVEMEKAAVRLAKEVGYVNAGTVEYLYDANDNFYFLELNPRLQVEHPVTEMITGMNLPAAQLQVAMGIPLHRIPDVRKFYGCDDLYSASRIDFDGQYAETPTVTPRTHGHTIAARITAENPFNGFQPTSGQITEINFRSLRNVWGYFSVDSSGRVHEFADSQIGHVFAWGENREEARRNLAMALNDLSIRGEIRTTIEYLKDLIEVPDYKANKFDTAWLDARIKQNVAISKIDPLTVVLVGAVCTGHKHITGTTSEYLAMLERGQLPPASLLAQTHNFELIYEDVKYILRVLRTGEITYRVECNNTHVDVELRSLADGGFLVLMGGKSHVAYAKEDVGAQRYMIDGQTCLFADEYDPTQMRALMGGKLLRYLVEDGATLAKDEPYAEIEVMKMNMQLCALEAGVITLIKPEGAVMEPGDIICTMELSDPTKVRRADLFKDSLPNLGEPWPQTLENMPHQSLERSRQLLQNVMDGYPIDSSSISSALEELNSSLKSPLLPVLEIEGFLSCNKNAMPATLVAKVEEACRDLRRATVGKLDSAEAVLKAQEFALALAREADAASEPACKALAALASRYAAGFDALKVSILGAIVHSYVAVESRFGELEMSDAAEKDDVLQELRSQLPNDLDAVMRMALANISRAPRDSLVIRILGDLERTLRNSSRHSTVRNRCGEIIQEVASLQGIKCTDVALEARQLLIEVEHSYQDQIQGIVDKLNAIANGDNAARVSLVSSTEPILTYLMDMIAQPAVYSATLRKGAMEVYVERVYASYKIENISTVESTVAGTSRPVLATEYTFYSDAADMMNVGSGTDTLTSVSSFEDLTSALAPNNGRSLNEIGSNASAFGDNPISDDASSIGFELDSFDSEGIKSRSNQSKTFPIARQGSDYKARSESIGASHVVAPFVHRQGLLLEFPDMTELAAGFDAQISRLKKADDAEEVEVTSAAPLSVVHLVVSATFENEEAMAGELAKFVASRRDLLKENGVRRLTFAIVRNTTAEAAEEERHTIVAGHGGSFFTFRSNLEFKEDKLVRNIETPLAFQLDLQRLADFAIRLVPIGKSGASSRSQTVHVYEATPKDQARGRGANDMRRYFVRALVRQAERVKLDVAAYDDFPGPERVFLQCLMALEAIQDETKGIPQARKNHIYLNVLPDNTDVDAKYVEGIIRSLHRRYSKRLTAQSVTEFEIRVFARLAEGAPCMPIRVVASNPTGFALNVESYVEATDPTNSRDAFFYSITENDGGLTGALAAMGLSANDSSVTASDAHLGSLHGKPLSTPYATIDPFDARRARATAASTTFCYDFPALFLKSLEYEWRQHLSQIAPQVVPVPARRNLVEAEELVLDDEMDASATPLSHGLCVTGRKPGNNSIAMVAWKLLLRTPQYPEGRRVVLIANDITNKAGSFGTREDMLFDRASRYARELGIPRLYIAANSGARIGLADEVKRAFKVEWVNPEDPAKGYKYVYLEEEDFDALGPDGRKSVLAEPVEGTTRYRITAIIGESPDLGVENLRGSGTIAGETSRAYDESFTLSYVSGRSVGIGAYLVRLGQRVVQKGKDAPILLTGYQALNSLMGRDVYTSNLQLGGTKIMFNNGVSHFSVRHDLEGVTRMINWLSFVPEARGAALPLTTLSASDSLERDVEIHPKLLGGDYDPRLLLAGKMDDADPERWVSGFFDRNSWVECLAGWAKTVITGRARLGKLPMGVVISEIRTVEARSPADPAAPDSQERVWNQAGQVWFPDSAFKTAQAINDFNREELPLIIFANWRGFSGGQRDMFDQVLKFGANIVDALVAYKQPVFVYLPPFAELRGGAWVVVDPTINPDQMEMYADTDARGGVLEAPGCVSVKYRAKDVIATAHRVDAKLQELDAQLKGASGEEAAALKVAIAKREKLLHPVFHQIAVHFADLHDRPGRMMAKGVIRSVVPWAESRRFFYARLRRRLAQRDVCRQIADISAIHTADKPEAPLAILEQIFNASSRLAWDSDRDVLSWLDSAEGQHAIKINLQALRATAISKQVVALGQQDSKAILSGLMGLIGNLQETGRHEERESLVQVLRKGVFLLSSTDASGAASSSH